MPLAKLRSKSVSASIQRFLDENTKEVLMCLIPEEAIRELKFSECLPGSAIEQIFSARLDTIKEKGAISQRIIVQISDHTE